MKNTLFVLLDGMEDDPSPLLDGKKPYEVAKMPFMYSVAPHKLYTTGRGYTQLFLNEFFTGHPPDTSRAALEAQGLGLDMSNGRTAYRLSPAEINSKMIHWSYHADEVAEDLRACIRKNLYLVEDHNPQIAFFVHGRAVLTMDCDGDPPDLPAPPVDAPFKEVPGDLGRLVMKVAEDMDGLTGYPWGCGRLGHQYPPFPCIKNMTAISDSPTALGVAAALGHRTHLVENLDERFPIARTALREGHVFLHVDEVDEYSHQKDPMKKIKVLERTDRLMSEYFDDIESIVYFVDHGTSCVSGEHILMTVPLWTNIDSGLKDGESARLDTLMPTLMKG
jgi:2,3-bisphosphoglycerate-independent phosphoglycerate mutase